MQKSPAKAPERSFGVQDVLFIVFKHKWMILILTLLGLGAAGAVHMKQKPLFQSEAKLVVRYAVDPTNLLLRQEWYRSRHDPVIINEIKILSSVELAIEVASAIGPEKLLPDSQGPVSPSDAAREILSNLLVDSVEGDSEGGSVMRLNYKNGNPELAKQVLRELAERYFSKHLEIHRSAAAFDLVSKQTEEVRGRLERTEKELDAMRSDMMRPLGPQRNKLRQDLLHQRNKLREDLMQANAAFVMQQARVQALEKNIENAAGPGNADAEDRNEVANEPPPQIVAEFHALLELSAFLQKRNVRLRAQFRPGNRLLMQNQEQIKNSEARLQELIEQFPDLARQAVALHNLQGEKAQLAEIEAKVKAFEENLKEINEQFGQQLAAPAAIDALERRRQMEETEYRSLELNLKNARIDQTLDPSRMPNITMVQQPTEPVKVPDEFTTKLVLGLAAGGLALGLGIAFLLELVFNRKIERPAEIQARLQ